MKVIFRNRLFRRLALSNALFGATECLFAMRTIFLTAHGLSSAQIGVVLAVSNAISIVSPLIGGYLADRFSSRYRVYMVAVCGYAMVIALLPTAGALRLAGLSVSMLLMPAIACFQPVGSALIATCSINSTMRPDAQGLQYPILRACMSAGYTVINLCMTPVIRRFGVDIPMYLLLVLFAGLIALRGSVKETEMTPGGEREETGAGPLDLKAIFRNYYIVTYLIANLLIVSANNCFPFLSYVLEDNGIGTEMVTTVSGIKVFGEVVLMLLIPRIRKKISLSGLQVLACVLYTLELLLLPRVSGIVPVTVVEFLGGMANGITCSTAGYYLRVMSPRGLEATAQSLWMVVMSIGGMALSLLFGVLIGTWGVGATYGLGAVIEIGATVLLTGSLLFGKYVLKKKNVVPLFFEK